MNRRSWLCGAVVAALTLGAAAAPTVYPTGVTIYDPARTWNGYTVLSPLATQAVIVIDMNGNVVKRWDGFNNSAGGPARVLPGGGVIAASGARPPRQESLELVQQDFAGNVVWSFRHNEEIPLGERGAIWSARQHHDWQREDFPAGYYSPDYEPAATGSNTLLLTHTNHVVPAVSDVLLEDDRLIEVAPDGKIVWEWTAAEHIDELGFAPDARAAIKAAAGVNGARGSYDWLHINSATYVGPNRWFDAGDRRFCSRSSGATAASSGSSAPTSARRPSCARFARSSASITRTSSRRDCPGPATCSCSTTAARAATGSPGRSRRTASAHSHVQRRACSRSIL
jgi:hypothetical protein